MLFQSMIHPICNTASAQGCWRGCRGRGLLLFSLSDRLKVFQQFETAKGRTVLWVLVSGSNQKAIVSYRRKGIAYEARPHLCTKDSQTLLGAWPVALDTDSKAFFAGETRVLFTVGMTDNCGGDLGKSSARAFPCPGPCGSEHSPFTADTAASRNRRTGRPFPHLSVQHPGAECRVCFSRGTRNLREVPIFLGCLASTGTPPTLSLPSHSPNCILSCCWSRLAQHCPTLRYYCSLQSHQPDLLLRKSQVLV